MPINTRRHQVHPRHNSRISGLLIAVMAAVILCTAAPLPAGVVVPAWPPLSKTQQQQAIDELKKFAQQSQDRLHTHLGSFETEYFLFCSDLSPAEARQWASLLDKMYDRLAETFAVPPHQNIWRGKALIFVYSKENDYMRYEREIVKSNPTGTAGMCAAYSDGSVKIAFYRQPDQMLFAHVLVHESVHGFIHRYRTPVFVPGWANEGLAEVIATDLVPQRGRRDTVRGDAISGIRNHQGRLGAFFNGKEIEGWQYPVAEQLTSFMIAQSKPGYVKFINGIKEGLDVDQALTERYGAPRARIVDAFGLSLGIRGVSE
jgi:hypothetical protein